MNCKARGIDFTKQENPDYCEQPFLLNHDDSYIAKFDEYTLDRPGYVAWFTHPAGPVQGGEMSDTVYYTGDEVGYHEHDCGVEVFLIDAGRVRVSMRGQQAVADAGDIVFIPPFTSHGFEYLEDETVWREWFSSIRMNEGMLEQRRLRTFSDVDMTSLETKRRIDGRLGTEHFAFKPVLEQVEKERMPFIRTYDFSYGTFEFPRVKMLQKVARYELDCQQEIWQYRMEKGFHLQWSPWNPHGMRLAIFSGSIKVSVAGHESFVAKAHDIINIPTYLAGELVVLEDETVVYDYACKGLLFRALEHLRSLRENDPDFLRDGARVSELLQERYDIFAMWDM